MMVELSSFSRDVCCGKSLLFPPPTLINTTVFDILKCWSMLLHFLYLCFCMGDRSHKGGDRAKKKKKKYLVNVRKGVKPLVDEDQNLFAEMEPRRDGSDGL
ncbi:hypothetical protein, unlikely [Trypanosoma brucei gambiense DAL972]|uniref:Uncharacterized protein n=1 Tax=Trypanosoma brucei gambiense (strain MHOM/CI/86/DAL972) TaxID=679716 RepID=D0A6C9_TRYB9|nr:hypothetical protein, unlikely [Trypanosoma brucei gambiense DAL972]CBH17230.1 hypothetical protein, unlikely [Trypanosoma brucei gambiense DAL972]|eukprot:XP_011779494.1 hypothetical protein, unlikely [Trypanosoma brucei gambiense DAL972]